MSTTPKSPFSVFQTRTEVGPTWMLCDANDQVIALCFDMVLAGFVEAKLNSSHVSAPHVDGSAIDLRVARAFVSTMLASFRVSLEADLSAPLPGIELDAAVLLADLAQWFGLNTGETAIACGPDVLGYVARLEGEAPGLVQVV